MDSSFASVFSAICVLFTVLDFYYAYKSFHKAGDVGLYMGLSAASAGIITLAYLYSVSTRSYIKASAASSIYFFMIDWMLVFLAHFAFYFTDSSQSVHSIRIRRCICACAAFDTAMMLINIFHEIAVHYINRDTYFAHYTYVMRPLYIVHLVFTYSLVCLTIVILMKKVLRTPRQYRNQYLLLVCFIMLIVLMNAIFLYPDSLDIFTMLDYSIFGYSLGLALMYWAAFEYRTRYMPKSLSMTIYQHIGQGIVLFDYNDGLIMHNDMADYLLAGFRFEEKMPSSALLEAYEIPKDLQAKDRYSIQCKLADSQTRLLQCDFRRLRDRRGGVIGNLFVFSDISNETDLLTGFQHWENFHRFSAEHPTYFQHPSAVAIFDIQGLAHMNRTFGREVGDERIRTLAKIIKDIMPADACFVRGYEAHLLAVCSNCTEEQIKPYAAAIAAQSAGTVLYGLGETASGNRPAADTCVPEKIPSTLSKEESRNIVQAIDEASRALSTKKLMSTASKQSQTISSLVRALEESDSDTEAHVLRTQRMGETLGRRIGLRDIQLTELSLLCLLHDIGKVGIPLEILNKPGKLAAVEWEVLRSHSQKGYQIAMSSDELKPIAPMILAHHERWDGTGYPNRIAGMNIPVLSRVIAIVDAYDAMVNDRAYRKGLPPEKAQQEIRDNAGTQFDPYLASEFLAMLEENPSIALGEHIGGAEIQDFSHGVLLPEETGTTVAISCSRYLLDLNDTIIEADDMFEKITGYSRNDVVGKLSQYELIPADDRAYYLVQVNNQFAKGSYAYLSHNLQRKDGQVIRVICYGKRYYDSAEKAFRSEILIFQE